MCSNQNTQNKGFSEEKKLTNGSNQSQQKNLPMSLYYDFKNDNSQETNKKLTKTEEEALLRMKILKELEGSEPKSINQVAKKLNIHYVKAYGIFEWLKGAKIIVSKKKFDEIKKEFYDVWYVPIQINKQEGEYGK